MSKKWYFDRQWPKGVPPGDRYLVLVKDPGDGLPGAPLPESILPHNKVIPIPPKAPSIMPIEPAPSSELFQPDEDEAGAIPEQEVKPVSGAPAPSPILRSERERPLLADLPQGPFDPREPLPWDGHVYPPAPAPPELPKDAQAALWMLTQASKFWDNYGQAIKDGAKELAKEAAKEAAKELLLPGGAKAIGPERQLTGGEVRIPGFLTVGEVDQLELEFQPGVSPEVLSKANAKQWLERSITNNLFPTQYLDNLDSYLQDAGIRYFSAREVVQHKWRKKREDKTWKYYKTVPMVAWWFAFDFFSPDSKVFPVLPRFVLPPPELWPNLLPMLRILDRFRHWLNEPVTAISGYRNPAYNTMIEGSKTSFHMSAAAIDFYYKRWRKKDEQLETKIYKTFFERLYRQPGDGLGRYGWEYGRFLHCDVGHRRDLLRAQGQNKADNWFYPKDARGRSLD